MSLAWYLNRLRAMSAREVAHRLRERQTRARWRRFAGGWQHFDCGDGKLPIVPQIGERLEAALRRDPALAQRVAGECGRLRRGELTLLGRTWPEGTLAGLACDDPGLFHRDPVSGSLWPKADGYCFDVPYRHVAGLGDVKYLWEINRLQFLQVAAAEARVTGDRELARGVLGLVLAWMGANPPFRGPSWCSGIELSARIVTLVVVLSSLGPPEAAAERARLRAFLNAHAFWLALYPSRHSSANNHAIAEGLGLFLAGLLAPDLPDAARHERAGRELLESECLRQLGADGVGVEQSPTYAAFTMEMIALAALVAGLAGKPLGATVTGRLETAAAHLAWIINGNGEAPAIGDNDEGRMLATSIDSERHYPASVAACVAGLSAAPALATASAGRRPPELREALFGAVRAPGSAPRGVRTFPDGGYSVVRDEVAGRPTSLVLDHGPLGYLSIAAHGHADALAVWLDVAGRPVLVDAGTWLYHAGGAMRDWFRSSGAHNTVLVEGASQSLPAGAFNWSHKANARLIGGCEHSWWLEAAHDGYLKRFGVTHVRRIAAGGEGEIVVGDRLEGGGAPRRVAIRFLLAPELEVVKTAAGFALARDDGLRLTIVGPAGLEPRATRAKAGAPEGWVSDRFGHRTPSVLLAFEGMLGGEPAVTRLRLAFDAPGRGQE